MKNVKGLLLYLDWNDVESKDQPISSSIIKPPSSQDIKWDKGQDKTTKNQRYKNKQ